MPASIDVVAADPGGEVAARMAAALWSEIQSRYGFSAPDPFDPGAFVAPTGGFWVAMDDREPVGSIGLTPLEGEGRAELDVKYVAPTHRRRGVAQALLSEVETHALAAGLHEIVLRAGDPQPEALRFYRAAGFVPMECFGRWVEDDTAVCLRKRLG
jgi:putative acetyltransferase